MSFDKDTRNLLAKTVAACRRQLVEDVTDQLRGVFGLHPDGVVLPLEKLTHLSPDQHAAARRLRDLLDHYTASAAGKDSDRRKAAYERMVLEISFTALNRLAALRLCEERGLVVECVRKGTTSAGFQMFERISGGALGGRYDTYRVFLECLFDELALDLGILFDRMTPQSAVFPSELCMEDVLTELNKTELTHLWTEDETIGWVYQYFNPPEERKAMRDASQAPRNSRELAVRNQFFTPRYVVEFLTDNTLGRIWYEMRKSVTVLKEECLYLVRRPSEVFLGPGEKAPVGRNDETDLSQEELLKRPVYIEHRPKKDPRDLRILDPACGSGHFLLYAFDLLERIYEEAWGDPEGQKSEATGRTIQEDFETLDDLRRETPKLIVEHNLHGVDIDPRAVQIAALALWLRAQKTWKNLGLKAPERPRIARSNIVTAEPMPGEEDMRREFTAGLKPRVLGQIVDEVFEKMKLAGEAGSLLKIEEEIKDAVAAAGKQWREGSKPEQQLLFPAMDAPRPKQQELRFDVKGVTDERFWDQAEDRILDALKDYAEQAENGRAVRRRLFAEDAARGFAFIDLCRKRYDTVLMNPPFGGIVSTMNTYVASSYPSTKNDVYAAFVERALNLLFDHGMVGAITSRTGFFLSSLESFRSLITRTSTLRCMADLGQGVLDSAMVKTASYVIEKGRNVDFLSPYFLLLNSEDKNATLIKALESLGNCDLAHFASLREFSSLPGNPFAYWAPKRFQELARSCTPLEAEGREVRQGLASSDDFRFIRAWWEVPAARVGRSERWIPFAKGGASTAYFADVHLLIDWKDEGASIKSLAASKWGSASRTIKSTDRYFYRGITYTSYTNLGFHPRALPKGCIFSVAGMHIHCPSENLWYVLGILSSNVTKAFLSLITDGRKFEAGYVKRVPYINAIHGHDGDKDTVCALAKEACQATRQLSSFQETVHDFCSPGLFFDPFCAIAEGCARQAQILQKANKSLRRASDQLGELICRIYEVEPRDISDCLAISTQALADDPSEIEENDSEEETDFGSSPASQLMSWLAGVCFGRWDVRIATDPSLAPKLPDPFDPLLVCPPGMLVGPDGLPAEANRIVGEEWLRARPDANALPPEGSVKTPTIPDSDYPLRISWDGVLVDDPGFNGDRPHRDDIVRRVREVFDLLWKDKSHEVEQEACDILGVSDLRDYFRKPAGFFQDHLKRYSKSRRKAPIYWPLSTASGSYTIWLYYHRLNEQSLYGAVNKYVEPKISEVERGMAQIENDLKAASGREATRLTDRLGEARTFVGELSDLREELLKIAALPYKPDLNDGVIINAAPFYGLFRLRFWAKDTEDCWKKLAKGDYDWAHSAYTIWPDRVREVCKTDRSIAIAHGLEDLCEVEAPESKKKGGRGRRKKEAAR